MMTAWTSSVTMSRSDAAEQQREPAHRGDPGPFDDAGPQLGDQAEAGEQPAEQGEQDQQAGHEDAVARVGRGAERRKRRLEQRREEQQVHDRLEDADEDPDRVAEHIEQ